MSGAEVFGIAAGVASLAGVFTSCVDCFEYIQLSRHFGEDYQRSMLKLDIAENRLTRWGEAIGLCDSDFAVGVSAKQMETAKNTLGEILSLFETLKQKSQKFAAKAKPGDLVVLNPDVDLDPLVGPLHKQLKSLAISRRDRSKAKQKSVGFVQKASWALYEKNRFDHLIDEVRDLVNDLVELLPENAVRLQRNIATIEVSEITDEKAMELLVDVTGDDDTLLQEVAKKAIEERTGHVYRDMETSGKAKVAMGDTYGTAWNQGVQKSSHLYERNKASDEARVQYGNIYGGKSVFDD